MDISIPNQNWYKFFVSSLLLFGKPHVYFRWVIVISNLRPPYPSSICRCHSVTTVSCTLNGDEPIRRSACSFRMPREGTLPSIPCSPPSCWRRPQTRRSYEIQSEGDDESGVCWVCWRFSTHWCRSWNRSTCGCIFFYLILFILNLWALHYPPFTFFLFVCLFVLCGAFSQKKTIICSQGKNNDINWQVWCFKSHIICLYKKEKYGNNKKKEIHKCVKDRSWLCVAM